MGKVMFMRKGEIHTEPVTYKANFADNTWEQIIEACQTNKVPETWVVGDQKNMTINGTSYAIDIIGKNHDTYSSGGTAPLTFQTHNCYTGRFKMNSSNTTSGGWASCAMRSTELPAILSKMPSAVRTAIREVSKKSNAGGNNTTINNINTTSDKLFLLAEIEVFGKRTYSKDGEGSQYAYYAAGNSRVKNIPGYAANPYWWERSARGSSDFCAVNWGGSAYYMSAGNVHGIAFAFCF